MVQLSASPDWLVGGGEMGALIRAMDWSKTPLGPVETWPQSLRTTVSLCLSSTFPILIAWGPERVQIYNDAYRPICGELHPQSMGQRFNECWASALPAVGHILDRAQSGVGSYIENLPMVLDRYGYLEEAFMTFSFSPIRDESGNVGGLFHPITEVTEKMLSARRTTALRELSARLGEAKTVAELGERLAALQPAFELDAPFVQCYELASGQRLAGSLALPLAHWPTTASELDVELACASYPEPVRKALVMPVQPPGAPSPVLALVAGVSPRRELDVSYRAFYEQLASTLNSALASVLAYEQEQQRARALAEIDRAKTAFFSNVSHEFRTPLTLMLGPLEDALADAQEPLARAHRERVLLVQRSGLRLLKLVNTLLDFSRIEAGRVQASYEACDLAAVTRDLASVFRSTIEKVGLSLIVDCEPLAAPVWVDREMWEKIVLNLISNAFKHTFVGSIRVALTSGPEHVQLTVEDTGVGVPTHELPRLFERFHRVQGARGRSYEGSGIGLALVQELVRFHGGTVRAESELERGTTFTVSLPLGHAHLPKERLNADRTVQSTATRAEAFVHEASSWLGASDRVALPEALPAGPQSARDKPRVVLADDNADMREYVRRLLADHYLVQAVPDGQAALSAVQAEPPELLLSDVMMPGLDGFGLLRALKQDPRTAGIPVILLSARAGEEATLEGLKAGASDYMVKPFSARELLARVDGALRTARAQSEVVSERLRLSAVLAALQEGVVLQDRDGVVRFANTAAHQLLGLSREQLEGRGTLDPGWRVHDERGEPIPPEQQPGALALREKLPVAGKVVSVRQADGGTTWLHVNAQPITEPDGEVLGVVSSFFDLTAERLRELESSARASFAQQLVGIVSHDLRNPLNVILLGAVHLLRRDDLDPSASKNLRRIQLAAERAVRLVRDLLDFTQARLGGGISVVKREIDLGAVVQDVLDELQASHPEQVLSYVREGALPLQGDPDRLAQVAHNLISNAIKYGSAGAPVEVAVRPCQGGRELSVHNQGPAIDEPLRAKLFEPFSRGSAGATREPGSIGLGLFIVAQIVRAHGGEVSVRSREPEGTMFRVQLP